MLAAPWSFMTDAAASLFNCFMAFWKARQLAGQGVTVFISKKTDGNSYLNKSKATELYVRICCAFTCMRMCAGFKFHNLFERHHSADQLLP
jgi:hypothetical protein